MSRPLRTILSLAVPAGLLLWVVACVPTVGDSGPATSTAVSEPPYPGPLQSPPTATRAYEGGYPPPFPTGELTPPPTATVEPTPTPPPLPTRRPTPVVTAIPTAAPPIIPLSPEQITRTFTIVYPDGNQIRAIESDGANPRVLADVQAETGLFLASDRVGVFSWAWGNMAPDGARMAVVLSNVESRDSLPKGESPQLGIYLLDLATASLEWLVDDAVEPVWSPDGTRIAFQSTTTSGLWIVDIATRDAREIYAVDRENGQRRYVTQMDWSPNSEQIVFLDEVFGQSTQIVVVDAGGIQPARVLVSSYLGLGFPTWSPDGDKIAFRSPAGVSSGPDDLFNLWVMNADGTDQIQLTQDISAFDPPRWSPDGNWIAFAGNRYYEELETHVDLWLVERGGGEIKRLTRDEVGKSHEAMPMWSPDGAQLVFRRDGDQVWVMSLASGKQTRLPITLSDYNSFRIGILTAP
jgi:dipeptidyl aminopeptidase/acylaminoacyl peptidase